MNCINWVNFLPGFGADFLIGIAAGASVSILEWFGLHVHHASSDNVADLVRVTHDPVLAVIAFLIALAAAYTAIIAAGRGQRAASERDGALWMVLCAIALGGGIWSMHFVSMLAMRAPVAIEYDWLMTLKSMTIAVLGSFAALAFVGRNKRNVYEIPVGGLMLGMAIVFMHYIGMGGIRSEAEVYHHSGPIVFSVIVSIATATIALALTRYARLENAFGDIVVRLVAALALAVATFGTHFTGLRAMTMHSAAASSELIPGHSGSLALAVAIAVVMLAILVIGIISARLGSRLASEASRFEEAVFRYDQVIENIPDGVLLVDPSGEIQQCNRAARRVFEFARNATEYPPVTKLVPSFGKWLKTARSDLPLDFIEMEARSELGREFPVELSISRILGHNTDLFVLVTRDISARKRVENHIRRLLEENKRLAATDLLTGLPNRRHLLDAIRKELNRSKRYGHSLSILILDIDHFKRINDTYGHTSGDEALRVMAQVIRDIARASDLTCRFGGEEFLVALPETSADQAALVAERLRERTEQAEVRGEGGKIIQMTISVGVAQWAPGDEFDETLAIADRALYEAKGTGRNRVVVAPVGQTKQAVGGDGGEAAGAGSKIIPFEKPPNKSSPDR